MVDPLAHKIYRFDPNQTDTEWTDYALLWTAFCDRSLLIEVDQEWLDEFLEEREELHQPLLLWNDEASAPCGDIGRPYKEPGPGDGLVLAATARNGTVTMTPGLTELDTYCLQDCLLGFFAAHVAKNWDLAAWWSSFSEERDEIYDMDDKTIWHNYAQWVALHTSLLTLISARLERLPGETLPRMLKRHSYLISALLHVFGFNGQGSDLLTDGSLQDARPTLRFQAFDVPREGIVGYSRSACFWACGNNGEIVWTDRESLSVDALSVLRQAKRLRRDADHGNPGEFENLHWDGVRVSGFRLLADMDDGKTRQYFVPTLIEWDSGGYGWRYHILELLRNSDRTTLISFCMDLCRPVLARNGRIALSKVRAKSAKWEYGGGTIVTIDSEMNWLYQFHGCSKFFASCRIDSAPESHRSFAALPEIARARAARLFARMKSIGDKELNYVYGLMGLSGALNCYDSIEEADTFKEELNNLIDNCMAELSRMCGSDLECALRDMALEWLSECAEPEPWCAIDDDWADGVVNIFTGYRFTDLARLFGPANLGTAIDSTSPFRPAKGGSQSLVPWC